MPIHPNATRCLYTKVDGTRCGSPAMEGAQRCFFHIRMTRRDPELEIPPVEDSNSLVFALLEIVRAIQHDKIEVRKASAMLYGLQLVQNVLKNVTLGKVPDVSDADLETTARSLLEEMLGPPHPDDIEINEHNYQRLTQRLKEFEAARAPRSA